MKHGLKGSDRRQRWRGSELGLRRIERGSKPAMILRRKDVGWKRSTKKKREKKSMIGK
jgi:hypothetical protein